MSGTPIIILVEPQLGENIGMTARAMANFGLHDMRLVNPRENWLNQKTIAAAAGAGFVIEKASLLAVCGTPLRIFIISMRQRRVSAGKASRCMDRMKRRAVFLIM